MKKRCVKRFIFFSKFRTNRADPMLVCLYVLSGMINGIKPMSELDNATTTTSTQNFKHERFTLNIEHSLYSLITDVRNDIVTTVANINSESSRFTTTIPGINYNTTDNMNVTDTTFKGSTKTILPTEHVLATKGIENDYIAVEGRSVETMSKTRTHISVNTANSAKETGVPLLIEHTTNAIAATTSSPINNSITNTTRTSSIKAVITSQTNIFENKEVKSEEIDVHVLVEYTANVTTPTSIPLDNILTKITKNSSMETDIMSPTDMPANKVVKSKETDVLLEVEDTSTVSTATTSNSMNKNLPKTTMPNNPSIEMENCELLRLFRCVT